MMRFGAAVLILASVHAPSAAFNGELVISRKRGRLMKLAKMLLSVDDDAEKENLPNGDWREFRAKLMGGGFGLAANDQSSSEKQGSSDDSVSEETAAAAAAAAAEAAAKNQAVAPRNQALLRQQNPILADEYSRGWAHATVYPEVGGLLLRRPFEAELLSCKGYWQDQIYKAARRDFLQSSAMDSEQMSTPEATDARFKAWTGNQPYMIRLTERIIRREISEIVKRVGNLGDNNSGSSKGNKFSAVTPQQRQLIEKFTAYSESWQEVLLVLSHSPEDGSTAVVINRPLSKGLSSQLAALVYGGQNALERHVKSAATKGLAAAFDGQEEIEEFANAFKDAIVYHGGPEDAELPGLIVHGNGDVDGSEEIALGTRIYIGGLQGACKSLKLGAGVSRDCGSSDILDYRIFVGRRKWEAGELQKEISRGMWQPVACARPIALKQCLSLPKPLWHEVMELVGGNCAMLSRFEFTRRDDLQEEEDNGFRQV